MWGSGCAVRTGLAAARDGGRDAALALRDDLEAAIGRAAGPGWPSHAPARDFDQLPAVQLRDGGRDVGVSLSADALDTALDVIRPHDPSYETSLIMRLSDADEEMLRRLGQGVTLPSTLGRRQPSAPWLSRLPSSPGGPAHHGVEIPPTLLLAFSKDHANAMALRQTLQGGAWNDLQLLRLVCMAELEGETAWLAHWIDRDSADLVRNRRARALLLRGWRAMPEDLARLTADRDDIGYLRHVRAVALVRAQRRVAMRAALQAYAAEGTQAWLQYRRLCQAADPRLAVEL